MIKRFISVLLIALAFLTPVAEATNTSGKVFIPRKAVSSILALSYEQIIGSNARNAKGSVAAGPTTTRLDTTRLSVLGGQSVAYIKLGYGNYSVDSTGAELKNGNAYTIEAAIEIPTAPITTCIRVTFFGSNTGIVPDGEAIFLSDQISASAFGYAGAIPAGTQIIIHDSTLVSNGQFIPVPAPYTPSTGEKSVQNNNGSSQVMVTGVPTGTEVNLQSPLIAVIGKFTAPEVSVAIFGDSIADFGSDVNGSGLNGANGGIIVRALWNVNGRNIPWVNLARSSSTAATASSGMSRRLKAMLYATHLVSEAGTNDLAAGTTPTVTQTALQAEWGMASNLGITHIDQMLILARTDAGNTTPVTNFAPGGNRDTLNTALVANVGSNGLNGVLNVPSVLSSGSLWASSAFTVDGIHPIGTGLTVAAAYLNTQFSAYAPAASAIASGTGVEATAVAAAFTTPPTAARLALIDFTIKCAKGYGLWSTFDAFYRFDAADSQAATINWKSPGTFNIVIGGSPIFTADRNFDPNGVVGNLLVSQLVPSAGGHQYTQNSALISFWSLTSAAASDANRVVGNPSGSTPRSMFNPRPVSGNTLFFLNDATGASVANSNTLGFFTLTRTASNARNVLRDLNTVQTDAIASSGLPTTAIQFLGDGNGSGNIKLAGASIGSAVGFVQLTNLRNGVILPYMQAVGSQ